MFQDAVSKRQLMLLIAISVSVSPVMANPAANANSAPAKPTTDQTPRYRATIHHSESLPPLPSKYQAGALFSAAYGLPTLTGRQERKQPMQFKIPDWLAGKWERTQSVETQRTELPSGKDLKVTGTTIAKGADVFGSYRDKNGQIWQIFSPERATGSIDRGEYIDNHTVAKYNLEIINPKSVAVEVRAYHLIVSKKKQRIVQSFQDEELNTYTLVSPGKLKTDSSVKVFDGNGTAKLLTRSNSYETRISGFDEIAKTQ